MIIKKVKRTDVINTLIETFGYKRYLEIGTSQRSENFDKIKNVVGYCVDPEPAAKADFLGTSDDYFHFLDTQGENISEKNKFDIVFIDGMHEDKQVRKDIKNSLRYLNPNGAIVLHDCLPKNEKAATPFAQLEMESTRHMGFSWNGDVYKAFLHYKWIVNTGNANTCFTVDCDYGCGVILNAMHEKEFPTPNFSIREHDIDSMTYNYLRENKKTLLNLVSPRKFKAICKELKKG